MAIPEFDEVGQRPPGVHDASWDEVRDRFGGTARRRELLAGLEQVLVLLAEVGCRRVWLDGSFVTASPNPGDVDLAWDSDGVERREVLRREPCLDPIFPTVRRSKRVSAATSSPSADRRRPGLLPHFSGIAVVVPRA